MPTDTCTVEPYVVLYAFRYGLPRWSYAHGDALHLIRDHWPHVKEWADSIVDDIQMQIRLTETSTGGMRFTDDEVAEMERLIDWIEEQPA